MTHLTDLHSAYTTTKAALDAAQAAERDARRAYHVANTALASALHAHVEARFVKDEVRKTASLGEIMIVGTRVETYEPTTVKAVFVARIKSGTWGKTRTTSQKLVWDFETNAWTEG